MSGVTPQSTTAQLAGQVSKDGESNNHLPGAFPVTPAPENNNQQQQFDIAPQSNYEQHQTSEQQQYAAIPQQAEQAFSVNPLPATSGPGNPVIPNESDIVPPSSDFTFNSVQSTVHDDEELKAADIARQHEQQRSHDESYPVAPVPFTVEGPQNPVTIAPGEKFPTPDEYALSQKNIHDKEELKAAELFRKQQQQNVSVNPLPATAGAGNPITLAPGIPVPAPDAFTTKTVNSNVKLDEASYNKPDAMVGGAPFLPPVVTPQAERDTKGTGVFDLPPITQNLIPESSLPMGNSSGSYDAQPFVQSSGPMSTTAQLAGQVPLERDLKTEHTEAAVVPEIVKESQAIAHFPPEASAVSEPVIEKHQVEDELLSKVPKAAVTADGTPSVNEVAGAVGGAITAIGGAAAVYANMAKEKVVGAYEQAPSTEQVKQQLPAVPSIDQVKESLPAPIKNVVAPAPPPTTSHAAPGPVQASISEAHASPEAAAYAEPIAEKQRVEDELLHKVPTHNESGEPAPNVKPVAIHVDQHKLKDALVEAQHSTDNQSIDNEQKYTGKGQSEHQEHGVSQRVPEPVKESISEAHASPEAAAYEEPIQEKSRVEEELLRKIETQHSTGKSAPHVSAEQTETRRETEVPASAYLQQDKQDFQEEQRAKNNQTMPVVTDGTQAIPVPTVSTGNAESRPQENLNVSERAPDSRDISPMTRPGERKQDANTQASNLQEAVSGGNGLEPKKNEKGEQVGHFHVEPLPPVRDAIADESHAAPTDHQPRRESHALTGGKGIPHHHPAAGAAGSSSHNESSDGAQATATSSAHTTDSAKKDKRRSFFGKLKDKLKN